MRGKKKLICLIVLIGSVLAQGFMLVKLPYTTCDLTWFQADEAIRQPPPTSEFRLGDLEWNVRNYAEDAKLEPFRKFFSKNCGSLKGLDAASCVSEIFLKKVPFGEPANQPFQPEYSPMQAFQAHMMGEPGHCVTYAGLSALILLSSGIPARMVQIQPRVKTGHNIIEVWDSDQGWVLFDPLNNRVFERNGKLVSAIEAIQYSSELKVRATGPMAGNAGYLKEYYQGVNPFDGAIVYPEPWLYTRSGARAAGLFYRGNYAVFGANLFWLGRAQWLLRLGILMCTILGVAFALSLIQPGLRWSRRKAQFLRPRFAARKQAEAREHAS